MKLPQANPSPSTVFWGAAKPFHPCPKAPLSSRSERTIEVGKVSPQRRLSFQSGGNRVRLFDVSWELHDCTSSLWIDVVARCKLKWCSWTSQRWIEVQSDELLVLSLEDIKTSDQGVLLSYLVPG